MSTTDSMETTVSYKPGTNLTIETEPICHLNAGTVQAIALKVGATHPPSFKEGELNEPHLELSAIALGKGAPGIPGQRLRGYTRI